MGYGRRWGARRRPRRQRVRLHELEEMDVVAIDEGSLVVRRTSSKGMDMVHSLVARSTSVSVAEPMAGEVSRTRERGHAPRDHNGDVV